MVIGHPAAIALGFGPVPPKAAYWPYLPGSSVSLGDSAWSHEAALHYTKIVICCQSTLKVSRNVRRRFSVKIYVNNFLKERNKVLTY